MSYTILLFYKYVRIDDPHTLMERERAVWNVLGLKGRMIVAHEGINATLEGESGVIEKYITHIRSDRRFKDVNIKTSVGTGDAFPKVSIKVKSEIVSTKFPEHINPRKKTGKYLQPHDFKKMYEDNEDFVVVDMRNEYELASGYFDKTLNIGLENSRDLAKSEVIEKIRIHAGDKKIVTVCTGGVRCEKMSAYLLDQGFKDVYQLHNGMHGFMEKYPGEHFKGALYTFDGRKVMHWGGDREVVGVCLDCNVPTEDYYDLLKEDGHEAQVLFCKDCAIKRGDTIRR